MEQAIELCKLIYNTLKDRDIYPALTGGTLYKEGDRKDIDIIMYRGTTGGELCIDDVKVELCDLGITPVANYGRVAKGKWKGIDIDFIFPEAPEGEYPEDPTNLPDPHPLNMPY